MRSSTAFLAAPGGFTAGLGRHLHHPFATKPLRLSAAEWVRRILRRQSSLFAKRWSATRYSLPALRRRAVRRSPTPTNGRPTHSPFDRPNVYRPALSTVEMEILPSALCWRIRVPPFIRISTIRKSGYFASVLELRPVFRCQESSRRSCCSSRSKSICNRGSANPGNRVNTSMPSPGWQALRSVVMMNLPPVQLCTPS